MSAGGHTAAALTSQSIRALIRERGIFAFAVPAGMEGKVLLASLGLDLEDRAVRERLLELLRLGEILLVRVDLIDSCRDSLGERGLDAALLDSSEIRHSISTFHAVFAAAVPTTAQTLTTHQLQWLIDRALEHMDGEVTEDRWADLAESATWALQGDAEARELCAAAWNRLAGTLGGAS